MNKNENSFIKTFNKINGLNTIRLYLKSGVLFFAFFQILIQGTSKKSLEIVRNSVDNKVLNKLRRRYKGFINDKKKQIQVKENAQEHSNKIWVFWLQGIENAPEIVQRCFKSVQENLADKEIILLNGENYKDYVHFPEFIQSKIDNGNIGAAHMSDLLRLELLEKYGGTWIDATVFISSKEIPEYIFNSDFFMYQKLKPGLDGNPLTISNWFISSKTNNPILILTKELLYEYWKKNNEAIHYFIFHMFFQLSVEVFNDTWNAVIPTSSSSPHILQLKMFEEYRSSTLDSIFTQTSIHKLTYKFSKEDQEKNNTYYQRIVEEII